MANYELFKAKIEDIEGGYQERYTDAGNWINPDYVIGAGTLIGTNKGIAAPTLKSLRGSISREDMMNLTWEESHKILKDEYWDRVKADSIKDQSIAENLADHAINEGPADAIKMVQKILESDFGINITVDGIAGTKTVAAINKVLESGQRDALLKAILDSRSQIYASASNPGWNRRLAIINAGNMAIASMPFKVSIAWYDLLKNIQEIDVAKFITFAMLAVILFFLARKKRFKLGFS